MLNIFDIDSINNFEILNWNSFSDHAALHFTFLKKVENSIRTQNENITFQEKLIFNEELIPEYKNLLQQHLNILESNHNQTINIQQRVETLTNFVHDNAKNVFSVKTNINPKNKKRKLFNNHPRWFNENCYKAKQDFKNSRNIFLKNKSVENRMAFVKTRTKYNKIRQKAKYN